MEQQPLDQVLALAGVLPGERVLDLSSLAGGLALRVATVASSVEVVQPDEDLAREGRRLASTLALDNVYFHAGKLQELPFDTGQFSLVMWCRGLSLEPQPLAVLTEIRRVLSQAGRVVLQEITAFSSPDLDLRLWELERQRQPRHLVFYTRDQIGALVALGGLELAQEERCTLTQDFDYWTGGSLLTGPDIAAMKRELFALPPNHQDLIDLSFSDSRISFGYPLATLLLRPKEV